MLLNDSLPSDVKESMRAFEVEYGANLDSKVTGLEEGLELVRQGTGKHIRPIILMLTAASLGRLDERVVDGAIFLELLHVATLVHDDVVDESMKRRGRPSVNAFLDNHRAVLVGDYILSLAITKAVDAGDLRILRVLAEIGQGLAEGEFRQMSAARNGFPTEEEYFDIIRAKTASLMAACCKIGAILAGIKDIDVVRSLGAAGEALGMAFQIKDDIFDYTGNDAQIGKPVGNDLREHKVTLPLLYALKSDSEESLEMKRILNKESLESAEIDRLIDFARNEGGVDSASAKLDSFVHRAKELFRQYLPPNEYRDALLRVCDFVESRRS